MKFEVEKWEGMQISKQNTQCLWPKKHHEPCTPPLLDFVPARLYWKQDEIKLQFVPRLAFSSGLLERFPLLSPVLRLLRHLQLLQLGDQLRRLRHGLGGDAVGDARGAAPLHRLVHPHVEDELGEVLPPLKDTARQLRHGVVVQAELGAAEVDVVEGPVLVQVQEVEDLRGDLFALWVFNELFYSMVR